MSPVLVYATFQEEMGDRTKPVTPDFGVLADDLVSFYVGTCFRSSAEVIGPSVLRVHHYLQYFRIHTEILVESIAGGINHDSPRSPV